MQPLRALGALAALVAALSSVGCGARTGLRVDEPEPDAALEDAGPDAALDAGVDAADSGDAADAGDVADVAVDAAPPECVRDRDCDLKASFCAPYKCILGACVPQPAPTCDDKDSCTDDRCDTATNRCVNAPRTVDADGDGFKAPLPGTTAGRPGSCGDDCNDANRAIFPGAAEVCNGIDDNCDARIDENARYQTVGSEVRLSPTNATIAQVTSVSATSSGFFLGYSAAIAGASRFSPYGARLDAALARQGADLDFTAFSPSDGDGARAAWVGDRYGLVWADRRFGNYEVFFALANASLQKLAPGDVRLSTTRGFSIIPSVLWTGRDFLVVWQQQVGGSYDINASRVSADGSTVGSPVSIRAGQDSRNVAIVALPAGGFVLAWLEGSAIGPVVTARVNVMLLSEALVPLTGPVDPFPTTVNGGPTLTLVDGKVAVAVHANTGVANIAVLDPGTLKTLASLQLTDGRSFGRDVALLGVGPRLAVAWADDRDDQRTFEIYLQTFDSSLRAVAPPARVTTAPGDSVSPVLAPFGTADAIVAWNDGRNGRSQVYGRALQCTSPPPR